MNRNRIKVTIVKEDEGFSASANSKGHSVHTEGNSFGELIENMLEALDLATESDQAHRMEDLRFSYDLKSFFMFYKVLNAKVLSERIGMNQSLLAQYISGKKNPSPRQSRRILNGVRQIGRELSEVDFIMNASR